MHLILLFKKNTYDVRTTNRSQVLSVGRPVTEGWQIAEGLHYKKGFIPIYELVICHAVIRFMTQKHGIKIGPIRLQNISVNWMNFNDTKIIAL
jgi:hypothetical protein